MRGKLVAVTLAATALAGCGATKYVTQTQTQTTTATQTQTQTQTTTVVKHTSAPITNTITITNTVTASSAANSGGGNSGGYDSTYPGVFEDSFITECVNSGSDRTACSCALRYIEQHVDYSTVVAAEHDIAIGNDPSWYTAAQTSCAGQ